MKITSKQAAEKLNCTPSAVRNMIKRGQLTDLGKNGNGETRHALILNSTEVNELAKTWKNRKRPSRASVAPAPKKVPGPVLFIKRLDAIEAKLDALIGMWS